MDPHATASASAEATTNHAHPASSQVSMRSGGGVPAANVEPMTTAKAIAATTSATAPAMCSAGPSGSATKAPTAIARTPPLCSQYDAPTSGGIASGAATIRGSA